MENRLMNKRKLASQPNAFMQENTAQVNKILAGILWVMLIAVCGMFLKGLAPGVVAGSLLVELILATVLIFKTKRNTLTMAVLSLCPFPDFCFRKSWGIACCWQRPQSPLNA